MTKKKCVFGVPGIYRGMWWHEVFFKKNVSGLHAKAQAFCKALQHNTQRLPTRLTRTGNQPLCNPDRTCRWFCTHAIPCQIFTNVEWRKTWRFEDCHDRTISHNHHELRFKRASSRPSIYVYRHKCADEGPWLCWHHVVHVFRRCIYRQIYVNYTWSYIVRLNACFSDFRVRMLLAFIFICIHMISQV